MSNLLLFLGVTDPCAAAPSITGLTKTTDELNNCFGGGSSGWYTEWTVALSGSLPSTLEIYWEKAPDSGGSSWSYWGRGSALQKGH